MTTIQIKNRYTNAALFECEAPDDLASGSRTRHALEKATAAEVNLSDAYLRGAHLSGANLSEANLSGADLSDAYLRDANLRGANLRGAHLSDAYLRGAYLSDANLSDAYLRGTYLSSAHLSDTKKITGDRPYFAIGPIGSRQGYVALWITDNGPVVKCGCFTGSLDEFAAAVEKTHGDSTHGKEYRIALLLLEAHAVLWSPEAHIIGEPT